MKYIDLLEKSYVVFRLHPYKSNKRNVISKRKKVYFYDLGIRNSIINNFNDLDSRNDSGELFENLCLLERMKYREYKKINANQYFWRTYHKTEIDLIEERNGKLFAYEFKISKNPRNPGWKNYKVINKKDLWRFTK